MPVRSGPNSHYLRERYGRDHVVASDIRADVPEAILDAGPYEALNVTDPAAMTQLIKKYQIDTVFHLASILSAAGENNPQLAWNVNMNGLYATLEVARELKCAVFAPSSIAAFGPSTPRDMTPQDTLQRPTSMYGVTKVAGELLMDYYFQKFQVDTRGVRYPGLISYVAPPGGGTTDYAVDIYYKALQEKKFSCFLSPDSALPMMYMPDALKATVDLMEADPAKLTHRNAYNVAAVSFTPTDLALSILKYIPDFQMSYDVSPMRQAIADSWPRSMDDSVARTDWGWTPAYDLDSMTVDMLKNLKIKLQIS